MTPASTGAQVQTPLTVKKKTAAILSGNAPAPQSTVINGTAKSAGIANVQSGQKGTTANDVADKRDLQHAAGGQNPAGAWHKGTPTAPKGPNGPTPAVTNLNAKPGLENKLSTTTPDDDASDRTGDWCRSRGEPENAGHHGTCAGRDDPRSEAYPGKQIGDRDPGDAVSDRTGDRRRSCG